MGIRAMLVGVLVASVLMLVGGCGNGSKEGPVVETVPQGQPTTPGPEVGTPPEAPSPDEVVTETAEQEKPPAMPLRLTFVPGQRATYKVTTETQKSITWEGDVSHKPKEFTGGITGSHIEITFDQEVERVDEQGDALLKITIKALVYVGRVKGDVVLEFDSARAQDPNGPMADLIGQSYRLHMTTRGSVSPPADIDAARRAVQGDLAANLTAMRLLSDRVVMERHEITALATLEAETVHLQDHWSNVEKFSFGMMGAKVYERVYTLQEVKQADGANVAVVEMQGIPSAAAAEQLAQTQPTNPFAGMSDSTGRYEGRLDLNLDTGQVDRYNEQLKAQWLVVDPTAAQKGHATPAVLRMLATQVYKLERIE